MEIFVKVLALFASLKQSKLDLKISTHVRQANRLPSESITLGIGLESRSGQKKKTKNKSHHKRRSLPGGGNTSIRP
jgi:hypothetical protein